MLKKILRVLGIIVGALVLVAVVVYFVYLKPAPPPISPEDRAAISLMPLPAELELGSGRLVITSGFKMLVDGPDDSLVTKGLQRFEERLKSRVVSSASGNAIGLSIKYDSAARPVQPVNVNESYSIGIDGDAVELRAVTSYGVLRGLETLSQLVTEDNGTFYLPEVELHDLPRYRWRGLMIDVGRHFIPKEVILRNLEAMAAVKMNVLHWHLSEYQGFRVESKKYPKLHEQGSEGKYYTQDDIREVVAFARDRGIRVIPEFDMPGHTQSFFVGYPELASAPGPYKLATSFGVLRPVMDPTREEVYKFLEGFVGEMATLFPDLYFHIGGDEVDFADWEDNPSIQAYMKANEITSAHELQTYFNKRMQEILARHGKKMAGWDEILNPQLGNDIAVQSWRSHKSLFEAVQKGNQAILSAGYYLDHKLPASRHYQVDPEQLPGAVTIEPDTLHWQKYDLSLFVSETPMKVDMVLYGQAEDLRGVFFMMESASAFEHADRTGDKMSFSFESSVGKIDVKSQFAGDSVSGTFSLGLLSFPFKGVKSGGDDRPGTKPPVVQQIRPLTAEEKGRILGGEAAMWTEVVSAENIDSRIWPRTAALAEKWWSPADLTRDVPDMYRRLQEVSAELQRRGVQHIAGQERLIADLAQGKDTRPLSILVDVLEEVKYYERLTLGGTTLTPMNEVVDAARPESETARRFAMMTDEFLGDPGTRRFEKELREYLKLWEINHESFRGVAKGNPRLEKVMPISEKLSVMSRAALQAMDAIATRTPVTAENKKAMIEKMSSTPRAGVLLAVAPALTKIVEATPVRSD